MFRLPSISAIFSLPTSSLPQSNIVISQTPPDNLIDKLERKILSPPANVKSPDFLVIQLPESFQKVTEIKHWCRLFPHSSNHRLLIFLNFDRANRFFINALLKLLEEPPKHLLFFIFTSSLSFIPNTLISRCQIWSFNFQDLKDLQATEVAETNKFEFLASESLKNEKVFLSCREAVTSLETKRIDKICELFSKYDETSIYFALVYLLAQKFEKSPSVSLASILQNLDYGIYLITKKNMSPFKVFIAALNPLFADATISLRSEGEF